MSIIRMIPVPLLLLRPEIESDAADHGVESNAAPSAEPGAETVDADPEDAEQSVAAAVPAASESVSASDDEKEEERVSSSDGGGGGRRVSISASASASTSSPSKRKRKRKLMVAAEAVASGRLKKATDYRRFVVPLYSAPLNVAERKKACYRRSSRFRVLSLWRCHGLKDEAVHLFFYKI